MSIAAVLLAASLVTQTPVSAPSQAPAGYVIGRQDIINITVFDEADLNLNPKYRVDEEGKIRFPLIGLIDAAGLTLTELQERIRSKLSPTYYRDPQVRAEIDQIKSRSVMVMGEVRSPGRITMTPGMTLLEALAAAGSLNSAASSEIIIAHPKEPGSPAKPAAGSDPTDAGTRVTVNLRDVQMAKIADIPLKDGDIITVPKAQQFSITGQVKNGGLLVHQPGLTIDQAISMAGGLTELGTKSRVTIRRIVNGVEKTISAKPRDKVLPDDFIEVGKRRL